MKFDLRKEDWPLIRAAIGLGYSLLTQDITKEQEAAIRWLITALEKLPEPSFGVDAEYGFEVYEGDVSTKGLFRSWYVGMCPAEYCPCILEIGSVYTPNPELDDIFEKVDNELHFEVWLGKKNEREGTHNFDRWIEEVRDPNAYKSTSVHFEIEAYI